MEKGVSKYFWTDEEFEELSNKTVFSVKIRNSHGEYVYKEFCGFGHIDKSSLERMMEIIREKLPLHRVALSTEYRGSPHWAQYIVITC